MGERSVGRCQVSFPGFRLSPTNYWRYIIALYLQCTQGTLLFDRPSDKLAKHSAGLQSLPFLTIVSTRPAHTFERESGEQLYVCSGRQ